MECIRQTNEVKVECKAVKTSKLSQRIYGLEGILALKNFKRNRKRYRSIVFSLVLSVVLFIATSAFVIDLKQVSKQVKEVTDYDIGFGTQNMVDSEMLQLYNKLKGTVGFVDSTCQVLATYSCTVTAEDLSGDYWESAQGHTLAETLNLPMKIQFLDETAYLKIIQGLGLPPEEYTGTDGKIIAVAKWQDISNPDEGSHKLINMFTRSSGNFTITPRANDGTMQQMGQNINLTFVDIVPPDAPPITGVSGKQPYFFQVIAPWPMKDALGCFDHSDNVTVKGFTFQSENPSQSVSVMKTIIEGAGIASSYIILNSSEVFEENRNYVFIVNVFAYTFIVMISLIAVANVFNTISTNIRLRRQEFAMLRSVGMSDRDFNKMMGFECVFYGMKALLFGLPIAVVTSWLIYRGMFIGGADGIYFVLPLVSIGVSGGIYYNAICCEQNKKRKYY